MNMNINFEYSRVTLTEVGNLALNQSHIYSAINNLNLTKCISVLG